MNWAYLENNTKTFYGFTFDEADKDIESKNVVYYYNTEDFLASLDKPSEM